MGREGRAAARLPHFGQFARVPQRRPFGADVPGPWSDAGLRLSWKVSAPGWREGAGLWGASFPERVELGPGGGRAPPAAPWLRSLGPRRVLRHPTRLSPPPGGAQLCPARLGAAAFPPAPRHRFSNLSPAAPARRRARGRSSVGRSLAPPKQPPTVPPTLARRVSRSPEPHWCCAWRPPGGSRAPSLRLQTARSSLAGAPTLMLRATLPRRPAFSRCQELERAAAPIGGSWVPVPSYSLGNERTSGGAGIWRRGD